MAISNELLSSTLYHIRDKEVDQLHKSVPFLDFASKMGGIEKLDGGTKIQRPLALSEHSSLTALSTGYEPVSMAVKDVMQPAIYDWADFAAPVVISRKEEMENRGERAIVSIVEARMRSVMGMFRREINLAILAGTALPSLNTLNGFTRTDGFLEEGARTVAGQTNTVGGIQKSVVDAAGWYNQRFDAASAFGTNGLDGMTSITSNAEHLASMGKIDCIIASEAGFRNYKRLLQQNERYVDVNALDGGNLQLAWGSAAVKMDTAMPTNGGGGNEYSMYFINFEAAKLIMHEDGDFKVSDFELVQGTTTRAAQVYWKGQLIADHLGSLGVLYGGDTY